MQDSSTMVIDHISYALSEAKGDHTFITTDDFIESDVLFTLLPTCLLNTFTCGSCLGGAWKCGGFTISKSMGEIENGHNELLNEVELAAAAEEKETHSFEVDSAQVDFVESFETDQIVLCMFQ
ncbi:DNA helicase, partial [Sarracenia purpurea var. burkii]